MPPNLGQQEGAGAGEAPVPDLPDGQMLLSFCAVFILPSCIRGCRRLRALPEAQRRLTALLAQCDNL